MPGLRGLQDPGRSRLYQPPSVIGTFTTSFLTGGFSAAATKTMFAPVDRVKIVLQTQNSHPLIRSGAHEQFHGVLSSFRRIASEQGVMALWRGNTASVIRSFPTNALNFGFWGTIKASLLPADEIHSRGKFAMVHIAGGALAGSLTTLIVHPLDLARTRMAADLTTRDQHRQLRHLPDYLRQVWRHGGLPGLYTGVGAGIAGISVYRGLYFGLFEVFKQAKASNTAAEEAAAQPGQTSDESQAITNSEGSLYRWYKEEAWHLGGQWVCAQSAALCAGLTAYPLDSIRHRMMVQNAGKQGLYTSSWDCATKVWKAEGARGFFRGVSLSIWTWCGAAILLVVHDEVQQAVKRSNQ